MKWELHLCCGETWTLALCSKLTCKFVKKNNSNNNNSNDQSMYLLYTKSTRMVIFLPSHVCTVKYEDWSNVCKLLIIIPMWHMLIILVLNDILYIKYLWIKPGLFIFVTKLKLNLCIRGTLCLLYICQPLTHPITCGQFITQTMRRAFQKSICTKHPTWRRSAAGTTTSLTLMKN